MKGGLYGFIILATQWPKGPVQFFSQKHFLTDLYHFYQFSYILGLPPL